MSRHGLLSVALMRRHVGRSYVTLVRSASCRLSAPKSCLPAVGRTIPVGRAIPSQSPRRLSASSLLFADRHCSPTVSRDVTPPLPQHVPWYRTFDRQKNMYYGFASRNPPRPSRLATFYYLFLTALFVSVVFTPL